MVYHVWNLFAPYDKYILLKIIKYEILLLNFLPERVSSHKLATGLKTGRFYLGLAIFILGVVKGESLKGGAEINLVQGY